MTNEELVYRIRSGIDVSGNMLELYQQNKGMIFRISKRYSGMAEMEDLTQEGYIALCKAVDGYDPEGGIDFVSYAWRSIQRHLLRYVYQGNNLPDYLQRLIIQYKIMDNDFSVKHKRKPTKEEYLSCLGINEKQLRAIEQGIKYEQNASLDCPLEDGETTLGAIIPASDNVESTALDNVQNQQLKEILWKAVDNLPEDMPEVLRKRFINNLTLKQTGDIMGLTSSEVRVRESKGLKILKLTGRRTGIYAFTDEFIRNQGMKGTGVMSFKNTWTSSTERVAMRMAR